MRTVTLLGGILLSLELAPAHGFPTPQMQLNKLYADESHCLLLPEIRNAKDNAISCHCRDPLVDVQYVYLTYLITAKDSNLSGIYLVLSGHAQAMCGEKYDVTKAQGEHWQWDGPEVTRTYPSDSTIERMKADDKGFRTVEYRVRLTYRDAEGRITKAESFSAVDRLQAIFNKITHR